MFVMFHKFVPSEHKEEEEVVEITNLLLKKPHVFGYYACTY